MKNSAHSLSYETSSGRISLFRSLAALYSELLKGEGVRCLAFKEPEVPLFSKADKKVQLNAISFLEVALEVFSEIKTAGTSLRDNRSMIWRTLNRLKFTPDSQIFDKMLENDVIEVYSIPDHLHLAWNLRLMESVSFSVEQLLCQPWWELTTRPVKVVQEMNELSRKVMSEQLTSTFIPDIPPHLMEEHFSTDLLNVELIFKYISPIRQNGKNVGFIITSDNRIVGSRKKD